VDLPFQDLIHKVILVDTTQKLVSSSEAHQRVRSSPLFAGRPERARQRLEDLLAAFRAEDWQKAFAITWDEFFDMHELFHTAEPSFGYMTPLSRQVLDIARAYWTRHKDGPLVTMDAGANVHLLYRQDQKRAALEIQSEIESILQPVSLGPDLTLAGATGLRAENPGDGAHT
jgi:diphosphomevalonate decarboxylase